MGLMRSFNKDYIGFQKIKGLEKEMESYKINHTAFWPFTALPDVAACSKRCAEYDRYKKYAGKTFDIIWEMDFYYSPYFLFLRLYL